MRDHQVYEAQDMEALSGIPNYQEWVIDAFSLYLRGETVKIGAGIGAFTQRLLAHVDRLEAGFDVISACYFDTLGVVPLWGVHPPGRETRLDQRRAKACNRFMVPVGRKLVLMFLPPFGMNLVLVARKPGAAP